MYYKSLLNTLIAGSKVAIPIRLFTALPLKAFYDCLYRISGNEDLLTDFDSIRHCCNYSDDFTIRDFLNEKSNTISSPWIPMIPLPKYEKDILDTHEEIGRLLVHSFHLALPQYFCAEEICEHYMDPYYEDDWVKDIFCEDDSEYETNT